MEKIIDIFLVEDNLSDVQLTLHSFKKHHFNNKIKVFPDGEVVLDYLYKYCAGNDEMIICPKLILLDLKLPKVSGIEVLRKIKSNDKIKTIPIVILTSSKEESDINECYQLGANSYIVKPVDFAKFAEAIKNLEMYWILLNEPPAVCIGMKSR